MRLLADQDIYKITIDHIRECGHDLLTANELGLQQASDEDLLIKAQAEKPGFSYALGAAFAA